MCASCAMLFVLMHSILCVLVFLDYWVSCMYNCSVMTIYLIFSDHVFFDHFAPTEQDQIRYRRHFSARNKFQTQPLASVVRLRRFVTQHGFQHNVPHCFLAYSYLIPAGWPCGFGATMAYI